MGDAESKDRPKQQVSEGGSDSESIIESVARKVGSTMGAVAAKIPRKSAIDPNAAKKLAAKKKKKTAHRRKLKGSHAKG